MREAFAAAAAILALASPAHAASPVDGLWRAPVNHAVIEVYDCGPSMICGRVMESDVLRRHPDLRDARNPDASLRDRPVHGLTMMSGFRGGPAQWKDGLLYNPNDGHSYHGVITLEGPDTLRLRGCLFGPLCLTQVWTRAPN